MKCVVGGSGIVCARMLKRLGGDVVMTGFLAGATGQEVRSTVTREGLVGRFFELDGETRTTNVFIGPKEGQEVEYKEQGPAVSSEAIARLLSYLRELASGDCRILICGSTPPNASRHLYAQLIETAAAKGASVLLDAEPDQMTDVLAAAPDLAKCNGIQAAELLGTTIEREHEAAAAAKELIRRGASSAMISLGPLGAVLAVAGRREVLWAEPPKVQVVDTMGSGDCLLAGYLWALDQGMEEEQALEAGVATGTANSLSLGAGLFDLGSLESILGAVRTTRLEALP